MTDRRLEGLNKSSQKKKQSAEFRTKEALNNLINSGEKITVRSVAKKAGVSVSYIYKYPELTSEIQNAREQQQDDSSVDARSACDTELSIEQLQQENDSLAREIRLLKDIIKKTKTDNNSPQELQQDNIRLTIENQQLQQKLSYTQQKLDEAREFILDRGYANRN